MNQTEIDELRRLHEAATPGDWEATGWEAGSHGHKHDTCCIAVKGSQTFLTGNIPETPRRRATHKFIAAARNALPRLLAALEEARAERYTLKEKLAAMDLLLNNAERVVRDGIADRDAAETQAWDALGRPDGTHDTTNAQRLCEAYGATKAKLAALVDYLRDEIATSSKAVPSTADEAIGDSERVLFCQQLLRHEALAAAKVQP